MKKKFLSLLLVCATISTMFMGCSLLSNEEESTESTELDVNKIMKNLDEGGYYVVHNNTPSKIYFGNATYKYGESYAMSNKDEPTDRVMWYSDDWEEIPTFYEGDSLIFYSTDVLTETFCFERFQDFGYTIGVCKMQETPSGRFSVSTKDDDCTLYPFSDTEEIGTFSQNHVIIDTIGGKEVRANNITRGGTIYGLKKGETYKCEVYAGTEVYPMLFKANVRALGSMQGYISNDFDFLSSTVIKLNIPEWFNSGYYCIDGVGMFRYITGTEYVENMDMNVPNVNPEDINIIEETTKEEDSFFLGTNELGSRKLTISLDVANSSDGAVPKVSCTLSSPDEKPIYFTGQEDDENQIVIFYDATTVGEYKFVLSDLSGRKYTYVDTKYDGNTASFNKTDSNEEVETEDIDENNKEKE